MRRRLFLCPVLLLMLSSLATAAPPKLEPLGIALEGYEYPFPVAYHELSEQGVTLRMAYMDVPPDRPNGRTVVLMHGKNFCGAYWQRTARDLSKNGYRVIVPDQIGFGMSSKPTDIQYSFHMMARHTASLLDTLGVDAAAIVGHSMGGMVATRFALMYPDRTTKLVLVNPIGLEDWKAKGVPYRSVDAWYQLELAKDYDKIKAYEQESYYGGEWKDAYDQWAVLLARPTLSPEYPRLALVQAMTYDMIYTQPVCYEFANLKMPTLLIIGQRDRTALGKDIADKDVRRDIGHYPILGKATAKLIPDCTLVELDDVGHLPHVEAYGRFFEPLQQFLRP